MRLTPSSGLTSRRGMSLVLGWAGLGNCLQICFKITRDIGNSPKVLNSHEAVFVNDEPIWNVAFAESLSEF
jgi:hypothetical protein